MRKSTPIRVVIPAIGVDSVLMPLGLKRDGQRRQREGTALTGTGTFVRIFHLRAHLWPDLAAYNTSLQLAGMPADRWQGLERAATGQDGDREDRNRKH
jgi:hypothetical protein